MQIDNPVDIEQDRKDIKLPNQAPADSIDIQIDIEERKTPVLASSQPPNIGSLVLSPNATTETE